jgi:hypothetical protein
VSSAIFPLKRALDAFNLAFDNTRAKSFSFCE